MARKKKKRLSRKEQNAQRQAAIARKRKEKGWQPPQAHTKDHQQELLDDMLPLFPMAGDMPSSSEAALEPLMMTLLDSAALIDEPEFEDFMIDPLECVSTFAEVGEGLGIDPEELSKLPDEEREDAQLEILEETVRRLLTNEMRREIVNRLDKVRLRLKRSGKQKKVAQVAALQTFLDGKESDEIWPMLGLAQAIVQRSLTTGFELFEMSMDVMDADSVKKDDTPLTLRQKFAQSSVAQKADSLLKKVPGLSGFMEKQVDKIWDEGEEAIFEGELYLELYTPEELEAAAGIFSDVLGTDAADATPPQEKTRPNLTEETGKLLVLRIGDYVTNLFTPPRVDQLRTRLNTVANDPDYPEKWLVFILMLTDYLADENAAENEKPFLVKALLGELRAVQQLLIDEAESD